MRGLLLLVLVWFILVPFVFAANHPEGYKVRKPLNNVRVLTSVRTHNLSIAGGLYLVGLNSTWVHNVSSESPSNSAKIETASAGFTYRTEQHFVPRRFILHDLQGASLNRLAAKVKERMGVDLYNDDVSKPAILDPGPYRPSLISDGLTAQTFETGILSGYDLSVPDNVSIEKRHDLTELRSMFNWRWQLLRQHGALTGIRLRVPQEAGVPATFSQIDLHQPGAARFAALYLDGFRYDEPTLRARRIARDLHRLRGGGLLYQDMVHRLRVLQRYANEGKRLAEWELATFVAARDSLSPTSHVVYYSEAFPGLEHTPLLLAQLKLPDGSYLSLPLHDRGLIAEYARKPEEQGPELDVRSFDRLRRQLPVHIAAAEQLVHAYQSLEQAFDDGLQDSPNRVPLNAIRGNAGNLFNWAVAIDGLPMDPSAHKLAEKRKVAVFWLKSGGMSDKEAWKAVEASSEEGLDIFLKDTAEEKRSDLQ